MKLVEELTAEEAGAFLKGPRSALVEYAASAALSADGGRPAGRLYNPLL